MLKYLFIDESGDLGLNGSKHLVLACVETCEPEKLDRIIKNMRRHKFKKQLKNAQEIKASKSSSELIKHTILKFNELNNIKVHLIILEKGKIYSDFLKKDKHKLYNYISGKLANKIIINDFNVIVRIDKSKGKQILQEDFNKYFKIKLENNSLINNIKIYHSWSHSWSGLQFADVLAWACFQKFEYRNNCYLDLIDLDKREKYHVF